MGKLHTETEPLKARLFGVIILVMTLAFVFPSSAYAGSSLKAGKSKPVIVPITTYTETKTYGDVTAKYRYDLPVVKGKSKSIRKINKYLAKGYRNSLKSKTSIMLSAEQQALYSNRTDCHFSTSRAVVAYNKKGYLSIYHKEEWYAGGVYNGWIVGDTFSLKTGKRLNVSRVVAGNSKTVKKKILKAYLKKVGSRVWGREDIARETIMGTKIGDFNYYLKNGKVVVCFGPYSPGIGNGQVKVSLKGNYA